MKSLERIKEIARARGLNDTQVVLVESAYWISGAKVAEKAARTWQPAPADGVAELRKGDA